MQLFSFFVSTPTFLIGFFLAPILAIVTLVIGLASFGASFGLRKMYVKALLKIFEYATNIKQQKVKDCEELLDREITNPQEKDKALDKIKMLRLQSFMLKPPEKLLKKPTMVDDGERRVTSNQTTRESSNEDATTSRQRSALDDIDMQNNNYLSSQKTQSSNNNDNDQADRHKTPALLHKIDSDNDLIKNIHKRDFELGDVISFVNKGLEAIIDDEVTKRFTTEELTVWNLLSRTNQQYEYVSFRVTVLWLLGLLFRYCVLFPFRLLLFILACFFTFLSTFLIGHVKDGPFKRSLNWYSSLVLHRMLSRVFSAIITFHNREHRAKPGSICVANHTSPIDVIILSTDNCYSMIGQEHGGFTGMMQRAFSRASKHIWFDRSESKDRHLVAKRMRDHVADINNMPILIFPEGTCINNTSVMMFKKGCFEVDTTIAPVAIKYDPRFGDAFWNSSKHSMLQYLMLMMTSWAIVVDVFYLPPMTRRENEDAAMFASRVKSVIAKKGGFVDLNWDGMLKRQTPKLDLMYEQQQKYVSQLKVDLNKQS